MVCRIIQADSETTYILGLIYCKKFDPVSTSSLEFIGFQLPFGKKKITSKEVISTTYGRNNNQIEEKKYSIPKTVLNGYENMRYTLKFLAPSGDMKNHLPLLTILKCSQESWFLEKEKRKSSEKI